ncbi:MAG: glycosyltransferase family 4 protein, partial [Actinomycetota bacterium]
PSPGRLRQVARIPGAVRALREAIEEVGADVVHANGEKVSIYAGWAARAACRPCVFWLQDAPGGAPAARLVQAIMACTPRSAAVACSEWMARAFRRAYGIPALTIHHGVSLRDLPTTAHLARSTTLGRIKADAGWPEDALVALHAARLQRWKGTEVFLRAARLASHIPKLRFLVAGGALYGREREYAASLPDLASKLGLGEKAFFTGHRSDLLEFAAGSDMMAHCSLRPEPFGMVVVESMALGLPVIATRTGGPMEIIEDGCTGLLVPPGDAGALAAAMAGLAASPQRRRQIGEAAARAAAERFSAERMARRFEALYRRIVV